MQGALTNLENIMSDEDQRVFRALKEAIAALDRALTEAEAAGYGSCILDKMVFARGALVDTRRDLE